MKKLLASLLTASILGMNTLPVLAQWDIADSYWASKEINKVVNDNILPVDEDGRFNPENTITRIQFVQGLLKVLSNENLDVTIPNTMSDVSVYDSYYDDVLRGQQLGVVYGYPDGTFKGGNNITRAEFIKLLTAAFKFDVQEISKNFFTDIQDNWAKNYINAFALKGYAKGYENPDGTYSFRPDDFVTRSECVAFINRIIGASGDLSDKKYTDLSDDFWGYSEIMKVVK